MQLISEAIQGLRQNVFGRFKTDIWVIVLLEIFSTAAVSICIPFFALYLYQDRGFSMTLVGIVMLIAGGCGAATQIVAGWLSDRFGRRPFLLMSVGLRIALYSGIAVLIGMSAPIWAVAVAYIAEHAAGVMMHPITSAMIGDLSPKARITEAYGLLRMGRNAGWAAGPAVGGYLATFLPYAWLFGVAALLSALALGLILFFLRESFHRANEQVNLQGMLSVVNDRALLIFTSLSLLVFLCHAQLVSTLSVFTVDRMGFSTAQFGLLLTTNGLIVVFFQYLVARGLSRLSKSTALILGSLLFGFGYLSLGWVGNFNQVLAAIVVITAGEIVFSPMALSVVADLSPQDRRGQYMGFFGLSEIMGFSAGPLIGGILLDAFPTDPRFIWGIISLLGFAASVGFYRWAVARRALISENR